MTTDLQPKPEPRPERMIVTDHGPAAYLFDTARFEHMQRIAMAMARASLIPSHLRGTSQNRDEAWQQTVGNCLLIVNQAVRWDMDPFAVAPESYVVRGKLGFQGKLVAAVIHARGNLKGRLGYSFHGEGDGRTVTVAGQFTDEDDPRTVTLSVGQAKTFDKDGNIMPMWEKDPDQKLVYSGVTKWARRHCPELMLGVLTLDDLDRMAVSRMDGSPAADHVEQARLQREASKAEPPYNPPTAEEAAESPPGHAVYASGPQTPVASSDSPEAERPQTAAEEPRVWREGLSQEPQRDVGGFPAKAVDEDQHISAAEEDQHISAAEEEASLWSEIDSSTTLTAVNDIERCLDLDSPGGPRLKKKCAERRVEIRERRGGNAPPAVDLRTQQRERAERRGE